MRRLDWLDYRVLVMGIFLLTLVVGAVLWATVGIGAMLFAPPPEPAVPAVAAAAEAQYDDVLQEMADDYDWRQDQPTLGELGWPDIDGNSK